MADVWAENRQSGIRLHIPNLVWLVKQILTILSLEDMSLSVVVTDAEEIQALNRRYLDRDKPTNVISFPMKEGEPVSGDDSYLGDVAISVDAALEEGQMYGYSFDEMLLLYLIHGILHLAGYNHEDVSKDETQRMETRQSEIFDTLLPHLSKRPIEVTMRGSVSLDR